DEGREVGESESLPDALLDGGRERGQDATRITALLRQFYPQERTKPLLGCQIGISTPLRRHGNSFPFRPRTGPRRSRARRSDGGDRHGSLPFAEYRTGRSAYRPYSRGLTGE